MAFPSAAHPMDRSPPALRATTLNAAIAPPSGAPLTIPDPIDLFGADYNQCHGNLSAMLPSIPEGSLPPDATSTLSLKAPSPASIASAPLSLTKITSRHTRRGRKATANTAMSSPRRVIVAAASIAASLASSDVVPPILPTINPNDRDDVVPSLLDGLLDPPPDAAKNSCFLCISKQLCRTRADVQTLHRFMVFNDVERRRRMHVRTTRSIVHDAGKEIDLRSIQTSEHPSQRCRPH